MEEKSLKIEIPEGYVIDTEKSTFENIVFKKVKDKLPKTWEEFCDNNPVKEGECFIGTSSTIILNGDKERECYTDKNIIPTKELAKAFLALMQLIQLRDCYNDGWVPVYDGSFMPIICVSDEEIMENYCTTTHFVLTFKTEELRDEFLNNFKDLIEQAKPLL